jgi:magnesium-transporting ATPase (P-type)
MQVKTLWLGDAWHTPESLQHDASTVTQFRSVFEIAALCHSLKLGDQQWLGDPMEIALVSLAELALDQLPTYPKRDEIPFDTDRKRMSTIHDAPLGPTLYCKGALEMVLPRCAHAQTEMGATPLDGGWQSRILSAQERMAAQGLRVLAMAYRQLGFGERGETREQDMIFAGLVGLEDPPRPEVPDAIRKCHDAGIKVIMVTGDHPHTALAIARQIGLVTGEKPSIIGGDELKRLSATQLQIALNAQEIIFARVGADQKMRIVKALKQKRHIVAVTGDGVNDAPALKAADIGIAMGVSGTDVAKSAADMILLDDNFASIVAAIEEGRAVFDNIRKFLTYILTSNIPELVPYLAFALFKIPLPLTVVQILAVDLGTDMVPALGLGTENPDPGVMQRPPRNRRERLLTWPLLARAYLFLGVIEAAAAMAAFFAVLHLGGWHYGEPLAGGAPLYLQATAATLSAIIVMQVMNVWLCKHPDRPLWRARFLDNPLILAGIGLEIILIGVIDYTPWGQHIFGTAALPAEIWLFILPFAGVMLLLEEVRKAMLRKS